MKEIIRLKRFYIAIIIFTSIIFVMALNLNRAYISKTEILVIFKSEKSARNADQILENLRVLSESLPFYEKVLADEMDAQNEMIAELPDYKRKAYWNQIVTMKRVGGSSVLQVSATNQDAYTAEILSTQTIKTLVSIIGVYYDIRNDIEIRIINPAITKASFSSSYILLIFQSLLFGFILAFVFNYFLTLLLAEAPKEKLEKKLPWSYKSDSPIFKAEQEIPFGEKSEIKPEKKQFNLGKKAVAPDNLPISDNSLFSAPVVPKEEMNNSSDKKPLTHEATPEQVKERLNKLLSGKL